MLQSKIDAKKDEIQNLTKRESDFFEVRAVVFFSLVFAPLFF